MYQSCFCFVPHKDDNDNNAHCLTLTLPLRQPSTSSSTASSLITDESTTSTTTTTTTTTTTPTSRRYHLDKVGIVIVKTKRRVLLQQLLGRTIMMNPCSLSWIVVVSFAFPQSLNNHHRRHNDNNHHID